MCDTKNRQIACLEHIESKNTIQCKGIGNTYIHKGACINTCIFDEVRSESEQTIYSLNWGLVIRENGTIHN